MKEPWSWAAGSGKVIRAVRGSDKERRERSRAEVRGSERQSLNGRQMEETRLLLLTGGRSGVTELSKDRSLGDKSAAGPGSKGWCRRAVTEGGSAPPPPHVQTLSGPEAEELQGIQAPEARHMQECPRSELESQPSCATLGKHLILSESQFPCWKNDNTITYLTGSIEIVMSSL